MSLFDIHENYEIKRIIFVISRYPPTISHWQKNPTLLIYCQVISSCLHLHTDLLIRLISLENAFETTRNKMTAQKKYSTSLLSVFSTFLESLQVSSNLALLTTEKFVLFITLRARDDKNWNKNWSPTELEKFIVTQNVPHKSATLIRKFVTNYTPFEVHIFLHEFLASLKTKHHSESTIKNYRSDIQQFSYQAQVTQLSELFEPNTIRSFVHSQIKNGLKHSTIKRKLSSIAQFASWAETEGIVTDASFWISDLESLIAHKPKIQNNTEAHSNLGKIIQTPQMLVSEYLLTLEIDGHSEATIKNYKSDLLQFLHFSNKTELNSIFTQDEVSNFVVAQRKVGLKPNSIKRKITSITQFLLWAETRALVAGVANSIQQLQNQLFRTEKSEEKPPQLKLKTIPLVTAYQPTRNQQSETLNQNHRWSLPISDLFSTEQVTSREVNDNNTKENQKENTSTGETNSSNSIYSGIKAQLREFSSQINTKRNKQFSAYLNVVILLMFVVGLGFLGYQQFIEQAPTPFAYPSTPVRPNRELSFQGRLTDTAQNPITVATDMAFRLYDTGPGSGGTQLWSSGTCSVTPDQDGIFNVGLGDDCGSEISEDVFSENSNVWLEVDIEAETLEPRQSIKTVPYALNSETVQGYPITATGAATVNTILTMDAGGQVVLGEVSPRIRSVSGTFAIEAQALSLQTSSGSNGNITLSPDGTGKVIVQSDLDLEGYLHAPGATLSATYAGGTALVTRGGPSGTANIQEWQNSAGTALSVVDENGNIGIGTSNPAQKLQIYTDANQYISMNHLTHGQETRILFQQAGTTEASIGTGGGNSDDSLIYRSGSTQYFYVSTSELVMQLTSGGNGPNFVTVGPTSPTTNASFNVVGFTGNSDLPLVRFEHESTPTLDYLQIATNGSATGDILAINSSGNVGIGSATPAYDLDLVGEFNLTDAIRSAGDAGTSGYLLTSSGGGAMTWTDPASLAGTNYWRLTSGALSPANDTLDLLIGANATTSAKFAFINVNSGTPTASISGNLAIAVPTGADPATTYNVFNGGSFNLTTSPGGNAGATSRLFIANNGNIGIGTTTPNTNLHIYQNSPSADQVLFRIGTSADASRFSIDEDGDVTADGVFSSGATGTASAPNYLTGGDNNSGLYGTGAGVVGLSANGSQRLLISGTEFSIKSSPGTGDDSALVLEKDGSWVNGEYLALGWWASGGSADLARIAVEQIASNDYRMDFYTTSNGTAGITSQMSIDPEGNVGIGTNTPVGKLNVSGAVTGKALVMLQENGDQDILTASNSAGTTRFRMANTGYMHAERFADLSNDTYFLDPSAVTTSMAVISNVGIGTSTPGARLDVRNSSTEDILNLFDGATEVLTVLDGGNVGIGTTNPTTPLFVYRNNSSTNELLTLMQDDTGDTGIRFALTATQDFSMGIDNSDSDKFKISHSSGLGANDRFVIDNGGNVGIGTNAPTSILDVNGTMTLRPVTAVSLLRTNSTESEMRFVTDRTTITNLAYRFYTDGGNIEAFNILDNGNVGIGTNAPTAKFQVVDNTASDYAAEFFNDGGNANRFGIQIQAGVDSGIGGGTLIQFRDGDGDDVGEITFVGTTTTYGTSSDARLKENITSSSRSITDIMNINIRDYQFINDPTNKTYTGFIAQEVINILPEAVFAPDDGRMWSVDYGKFTPLIIKGVQDQQQQINSLAMKSETLGFTNAGDLILAIQNGTHVVTPVGKNTLSNVVGFAQAVIGKIRAGAVETKELFVSNTASIANLTVNSLQIGGQSLENYIISVIDNQNTSNTHTLLSPVVNEIAANSITTSSLSTGNLNATGSSTLGSLLVDDEIVTNEITVQGDATVSGSLLAELVVADAITVENASTSNLTVTQDATVAGNLQVGTITTSNIDATSSRIAALEAGLAQLETVRANTAELVNATVSGTLYADNIYDFENKVATTLQQPSLLEILLGTNNNNSVNNNDLQNLYNTVNSSEFDASSSADLNLTLAELNMTSDDVALTGTALFVDKYFKVNGAGYISDSLAIGNKLFVGETMQIADGLIRYTTTDPTNQILKIQPEGQGSIELLAGIVIIDDSGRVNVNGDLDITGNTKIAGSLLTDLLKPTDFGNPLQVQVAGADAESGEIKKSRFEIINEVGTPVATFSAEGNAKFAGSVEVAGNVNLSGGINLDSQNLGSHETNELISDKTSGKATIKAGAAQVTIKSGQVSTDSLVYITAVGSTGNQVLYVKSQASDDPNTPEQEGAFVVGFDSATTTDVSFNWWIVN